MSTHKRAHTPNTLVTAEAVAAYQRSPQDLQQLNKEYDNDKY